MITDPAYPTGLAITNPETGSTLTLDWNDNSESDLSGYNIYRSIYHQGVFEKLNASILTSSNYSDSGLTDHTSYYYFATAVDTDSNESYPSKIEVGRCASDTYQDYDAIIKQIQTILQDDSRLDDVANRNIYYENVPVIPQFPCITIELDSESENWATNVQKDIVYTIIIRGFVKYMKFDEGKEGAKDLGMNINDVLQDNTKIGGLCYDSQVGTKSFVPATWSNIPVFAAEMTLTAVARVTP